MNLIHNVFGDYTFTPKTDQSCMCHDPQLQVEQFLLPSPSFLIHHRSAGLISEEEMVALTPGATSDSNVHVARLCKVSHSLPVLSLAKGTQGDLDRDQK